MDQDQASNMAAITACNEEARPEFSIRCASDCPTHLNIIHIVPMMKKIKSVFHGMMAVFFNL